MKCKECNATIPKGSSFCANCGAKVLSNKPVKCSECQTMVPAGARFCHKCGTEISAEAIKAAMNKPLIPTSKDAIVKVLDQDGNGQVDIQDVIILAVKTPGVHVTRATFLQKELYKNHPQEVIDRVIATTPAQAGIPPEEIDKIADDVINFERNCVSGISAALGAPGGWVMAATIPADIIQYYGYTLRATQKLLYLYGFPEIEADEEGLQLDSKTINELILCLGIMNGVAGANNAIKGMAKALAIGVEKKLLNAALTKGSFYPMVKAIAKWFGVKMTKSVFAGFFKNAIPVVGGVIGGGITFVSFKPCCLKLKNALQDTMLSNPKHQSTSDENAYVTSIIESTIIDVNEDEIINESGDTEILDDAQ